MADNTGRGGNNNALYFIVGGLVVIAGIFLFLYSDGYFGAGENDVDVTIEAPAATPPAGEEAAPEAVPEPAPAPSQ